MNWCTSGKRISLSLLVSQTTNKKHKEHTFYPVRFKQTYVDLNKPTSGGRNPTTINPLFTHKL